MELDYLSVVDPGFASVVWPAKNALIAVTQDNYLEQIRRVFRFNLLWREAIVIRHIDLFNNIALMRFIMTGEARALALSGCLHLAAKNDASCRENFEEWALGSGSQHWHHFSPEQQKAHDERFDKTARRDLSWLEAELGLDQYDIELARTLGRAESLFHERRHVLKHAPLPNEFSQQAFHLWCTFISDSRQQQMHRGPDIDRVTSLLSDGATNRWRRRRFFTELERLGSRADATAELRRAIDTAKLAAVNQAFYDEFEAIRPDQESQQSPIAVSRNITHLTQQTPTASVQETIDLYSGSRLRAIDTIDLNRIALWHSDESNDDDSRAFRASIRKLAIARRNPPGVLSTREIERLVAEHVQAINNRIDRAVEDEDLVLSRDDQLIKAIAPKHFGWAQAGITIGSALLNGVVNQLADLHGVRQVVVNGAFTVASTLFSSPVSRTQSWDNFEATVKQHVRSELPSDFSAKEP